MPHLFLFGPVYEQFKDREGAEEIRALWTGEEQFLLSRNPDGRPYRQVFADVRDIVQGLVLALERDEAVGEVFNLGGGRAVRLGYSRPLSRRALRAGIRRCAAAGLELLRAGFDEYQAKVGI